MQQQGAFRGMLHSCKIMKFFKINFKILHCILATPSLIAKIHKDKLLEQCYWCHSKADLDHILLMCPESKKVFDMIFDKLGIEVTTREHILGKDKNYNPVVWVTNVSIYKAYLLSCEKVFVPLLEQFCLEMKWYAPFFGILQKF